ncbi:MAG TPA: DUF2852 domain-containing protein [Hyphomicrobium sp.]|jgi:hypothetical protein
MTQVVATLDDYGRPAWIAVMVLSFILFWPLGLAILAYMIWSGRMGCGRHGEMSRWQRRMAEGWDRNKGRWGRGMHGGFHSSGNRAFDDYREETITRLEEEEREFREFLDRLRKAKDKQEFDQFMAERRSRPANEGPQDATA